MQRQPKRGAVGGLVLGFASAVICICWCAVSARATPFTWGNDVVAPLRWPDNKVINVWIQNLDPAGANSRQQLFADGIGRWQAELDRGYTINVNLGDPPANTANLVRFTWAAPGTALGDLTLNGNRAITQVGTNNAGTALGNGTGIIVNNLPTGTAAQREFVRNLGMHEFCHALGLADDAACTACNHNVQNNGKPMGFNDRDRAEITQLYGRPPQQGGGNPRGAGQRQNAGGGTGQYIYQYQFQGLANEHISLITLDVEPELLQSIQAPTGWDVLDPRNLITPDDPYFDEYMEDGTTDPAPWSTFAPLDFVAFHSTDPIFDLTATNPLLIFRIFAQNDLVGQIRTWAGGEIQMVEGPIPIPEPTACFALLAASLLCVRRRRAVP